LTASAPAARWENGSGTAIRAVNFLILHGLRGRGTEEHIYLKLNFLGNHFAKTRIKFKTSTRKSNFNFSRAGCAKSPEAMPCMGLCSTAHLCTPVPAALIHTYQKTYRYGIAEQPIQSGFIRTSTNEKQLLEKYYDCKINGEAGSKS